MLSSLLFCIIPNAYCLTLCLCFYFPGIYGFLFVREWYSEIGTAFYHDTESYLHFQTSLVASTWIIDFVETYFTWRRKMGSQFKFSIYLEIYITYTNLELSISRCTRKFQWIQKNCTPTLNNKMWITSNHWPSFSYTNISIIQLSTVHQILVRIFTVYISAFLWYIAQSHRHWTEHFRSN